MLRRNQRDYGRVQELEKQRSSVKSLRDAHIEAKSERVKLKVSTAKNTSTRGVRVSSESKPRLIQLKEDLRKENELIASFSSEKAKALDEALEAQKMAEENFEIENNKAVEAGVNVFHRKEEELEIVKNQHASDSAILFLLAMLDSTRENETISNKEFRERSVYDNWLGSLFGFIEGFDGDGSCPGAFISPASEDEVLSRVRSSDGGESANVHLAFGFCRYHLGVKDFLSVSIVCKSLHMTVCKDSLLWKHIHTSQPLSEKMNDESLLLLAERAHGVECNPQVVKLGVPGCKRISIDGLVSILRDLKYARSFEAEVKERDKIIEKFNAAIERYCKRRVKHAC
ncbi:hypothetical protein Bca4012_064631 [Brassica carinata]|uniref:F-box domain-containing protein n=1 Tax=Brassica carinata TaxID=52824 RepID=A0A8X8AXY8_BRACI|nr:hypothetical protein Bca52824_017129 [Brassica carinata]